MMNIIVSLLKAVYSKIRKTTTTIHSLYELRKNKTRSTTSYYPEFADRRKSEKTIYKEQRDWILKYSQPNPYYFYYGFDIEGLHNPDDYVDYLSVFRDVRDSNNNNSLSHRIILRDKSLFGIIADAYGINTPKNIGIISNGLIYFYAKKQFFPVTHNNVIRTIEENIFGDRKMLFVKQIDGECAKGVYRVEINEGQLWLKGEAISLDTFSSIDKRYIIQEAIADQHSALSALHPQSFNTIRLVTVYNRQTHDVEVFASCLRVGTGDNYFDNTSAGGLMVGIDAKKGVLNKYGFFKPQFGTKTVEHPDSHIIFENYSIPYWNEVVNQAKSFHGLLYGVHSIGWDIGVTEKGPVFIEGNDNWEISGPQIGNGGLKKDFDRLFY